MFELFKKLIMAGQVKFEEGTISFLNARVVIAPADVFVNLIEIFKYDYKMCRAFYWSSKHTNVEGFAKEVSQKYHLDQMELAKWLINTGNAGGWGKMKFTAEDASKRMFIIEVTDGISKNIKSDIPVDHFLRGQIAGGASASFNIDFDCIERKCVARGDKFCEFVVKPRSNFITEGISKAFVKQIFSDDEIKKLKIRLLK